MKVTIKTEGLGVLTQRLKDMPVKVSARFIKAAGRAALAPVLKDAKANAPVDSGLLRDSLRIASRTRKGGDVPLEVGLTFRRQIIGEDASLNEKLDAISTYKSPNALSKPDGSVELYAGWRWHFIETGAPARGIAARPFLRPAFDANKELVLARFRDQLKRRIEKFDKQQASP